MAEEWPPDPPRTPERPLLVCTAEVVCSQCGTRHGDCDFIKQWYKLAITDSGVQNYNPPQGEASNIAQTMENSDNMLPQATQPGHKQASGARGARSGQRQGPPYLKVENLTPEPKRAKILGVRTENVGFNDLIVKVSLQGTAYFLGLKTYYQPYHALVNAFGHDENDWIGKEFHIQTTFDEFSESQRMFVVAPIPEVAGKKGR